MGNGNTGTLQNGSFYTNGTLGQPNGAVFCDGFQSYLFIGKNDAVYPNQILTWSIWFNPVSTNEGLIIFDDDSQPGGDRYIAITASDNGNGVIKAGNFGEFYFSQLTIKLGVWHHIVYTSDNNGQFLFFDGLNIGQTNYIIPDHSGRSSIALGSRGDGFQDKYGFCNFKGAICNFRIYNRALSSNEALQLYNIESTPPAGFETNGLVVYYPFIGNANDASGNSYNGNATSVNYDFDRNGMPASTAKFDGTNSTISVSGFSSLNLLPVTFSAWIKGESTESTDHGIITKYALASANGFGLFAFGDHVRSWYFGQTGQVYEPTQGLQGNNTLDNSWHQVVSVYDSQGGKIFKDGKQIDSLINMISLLKITHYLDVNLWHFHSKLFLGWDGGLH
jgi:hypothetical protein